MQYQLSVDLQLQKTSYSCRNMSSKIIFLAEYEKWNFIKLKFISNYLHSFLVMIFFSKATGNDRKTLHAGDAVSLLIQHSCSRKNNYNSNKKSKNYSKSIKCTISI